MTELTDLPAKLLNQVFPTDTAYDILVKNELRMTNKAIPRVPVEDVYIRHIFELFQSLLKVIKVLEMIEGFGFHTETSLIFGIHSTADSEAEFDLDIEFKLSNGDRDTMEMYIHAADMISVQLYDHRTMFIMHVPGNLDLWDGDERLEISNLAKGISKLIPTNASVQVVCDVNGFINQLEHSNASLVQGDDKLSNEFRTELRERHILEFGCYAKPDTSTLYRYNYVTAQVPNIKILRA